jgi:hypothetical protein
MSKRPVWVTNEEAETLYTLFRWFLGCQLDGRINLEQEDVTALEGMERRLRHIAKGRADNEEMEP